MFLCTTINQWFSRPSLMLTFLPSGHLLGIFSVALRRWCRSLQAKVGGSEAATAWCEIVFPTISSQKSSRTHLDNQFGFVFGEMLEARKRNELPFLSVSCWTGSQRCWSGCDNKNHARIQVFLAAGFKIQVLQSRLQWNALWHLPHFSPGAGLVFGKRHFNHIVTKL